LAFVFVIPAVIVIPAQAGTQCHMGPRWRGDDGGNDAYFSERPASSRARLAPSRAMSEHSPVYAVGSNSASIARASKCAVTRGSAANRSPNRRLRRIVDHIVRVLPPDRRAEVQHDSLRHDQATAEIQIGPHARRIEPQPTHDLPQPAQHVAGGDAGTRLGAVHHQAGGAIGFMFGLHRFQRQRH